MSNVELKEQILALIAARPNIRDVEISDKLDIDMDRIRPLIQADIDAKRVHVKIVNAPNGSRVDAYSMNVHAADAPVKTTKVDTAIEYLRKNGPVPTEFLSRAMGLKKGEYPSQYLAAAIQSGRVVCGSDKQWSVGAAAVETPVVRLAPKFPVPGVQKVAPVNAAVVEKTAPRQAKMREIPAPAPFRFDAAKKVPELAPKADPKTYPQAFPTIDPAFYPDVEANAPVVVSPDVEVNAVHDDPVPEKAQVIIKVTAPVVAPRFARGETVRVPDPAASRFVAGLLSSGELMIDVDGAITTLTHEQAKTLHDYLRKVGFALLPA